MGADLGTVQDVDLREAWPHEAHDFTPWLAKNLTILAQAVGIDLEVEKKEVDVGGYKADIVARVPEDATRVIIENQLEQADLQHLGQLLAYLAVSGLFVTVALVYTGGLQGTGDTRSPLYISMVSQVVVPIGLCTWLEMTRGLEAPDIWLAIVLGHVMRASLSVIRFRQGKWRDIAVDIGPARA